MKLVKLDKDYNIKLKSQVTNFLDPDHIYIPINNNPIPFQKDEEIKKGDHLFEKFYSPISGTIIGTKECTLWDGTKEKCLVIANDFQEKLASRFATRKKINQLAKKEIIEDLKDIDERKIFNQQEVKSIIISGIDDEPYIANEVFVQKENTRIILETIDALLNVFSDCRAYIVIKNTDGENIEAYTNFLGTYKKIELRLVDDLYLIGEEKYLTEKLNIKEDYIFLKATEVFTLYHNIKKRKPIFEKYITITGNAIENPQVFNVKIGTKVMNILASHYDFNIEDYDIYTNGLMQGQKVDVSNLIVSKELDGLIIMKKENSKEKKCIKCGKCIEVCPINSNPLLAYQKGIKVDCIRCGLCSYICPSYINLRKYLKGDNYE